MIIDFLQGGGGNIEITLTKMNHEYTDVPFVQSDGPYYQLSEEQVSANGAIHFQTFHRSRLGQSAKTLFQLVLKVFNARNNKYKQRKCSLRYILSFGHTLKSSEDVFQRSLPISLVTGSGCLNIHKMKHSQY